MACGILIVDKPQGWTSQDVVSKLRGVLHEKRVGHGGTLDPMATGVLPVFVGRATGAVEFFESAEKEYVAGLLLGVATNTQDTQGDILEEKPAAVTRQQVEDVLQDFTGDIAQIPPMFSAIKIGGKKLYELARQGKEVERKARNIHIFEMELLSGEGSEYVFRTLCSKGTYVRTLCHDMGEALGCGGCMSSLRRTKAGCYDLSMAHKLEDIINHPDPASLLLPVDSLFSAYPTVTLTAKQERLCRCGNPIPKWDKNGEFFRVYSESGEFLMVGRQKNGTLYTEKSFFEVT